MPAWKKQIFANIVKSIKRVNHYSKLPWTNWDYPPEPMTVFSKFPEPLQTWRNPITSLPNTSAKPFNTAVWTVAGGWGNTNEEYPIMNREYRIGNQSTLMLRLTSSDFLILDFRM